MAWIQIEATLKNNKVAPVAAIVPYFGIMYRLSPAFITPPTSVSRAAAKASTSASVTIRMPRNAATSQGLDEVSGCDIACFFP